jgi:hypothetical protein
MCKLRQLNDKLEVLVRAFAYVPMAQYRKRHFAVSR